jgi:dephospho-CoA kinase
LSEESKEGSTVSHWANKYVIGLTGNIAVGKSIVRQMLQHLGAYTLDADGLVHQAMAPGAPAYKPIVQTFGELILDEDRRINRAMLGSIVFSNPAALKKLEAITHPVVRHATNILVSRAKQPIVVIEAIKLLEGELAGMVDEIWVVNARPEVQYQRLIEKRKMSPEEAKKRILAQNPQAEKVKAAHVVIDNSGSIEDTWKQVQSGWTAILKKLQPPAAPPQPAATPAQPAASAPVRPVQQVAPTPVAQVHAVQEDHDVDEIPSTPLAIDTSSVHIKRGMPNNASAIATFIAKQSGRRVESMDVMIAFGEKSFLLAQDASGRITGLMGWQVENLITRVDEFYLDPAAPKRPLLHALIHAVEAASKDLQSEVGFIFVPQTTHQDVLSVFTENGYHLTTVKEIKIPAWREAIQDTNVGSDRLILHKPLRKDRVLKPI